MSKKPELFADQAALQYEDDWMAFARIAAGKTIQPKHIAAIRSIMELSRDLSESVRFVFPAYGCLFGGEPNIGEKFPVLKPELVNLPHPAMTVEYIYPGSDSAKRVLVLRQSEKGGPIQMRVVWWSDQYRRWGPAETECYFSAPEGLPYPRYRMLDGSPVDDAAFGRAYTDHSYELLVLWQMFAVLSIPGEAPVKRSLGTKPLPVNPQNSYRVLAVGPDVSLRPRAYRNRSVFDQPTDRRGPRSHFRRAHVRRLASGNFTWVRHSVVNAGAGGGSIEKHYRVGVSA